MVIQITDDEKFLFRGVELSVVEKTLKKASKTSYEERTRMCSAVVCLASVYSAVVLLTMDKFQNEENTETRFKFMWVFVSKVSRIVYFLQWHYRHVEFFILFLFFRQVWNT